MKANSAAIVWTNMDENSAHKKTWYHISENSINKWPSRNPITSPTVSNSVFRTLVDIVLLVVLKTVFKKFCFL